MAARSIKTIFRDFWYIIFAELSSRYSKLHWDSIVENVEKMIGCGDPSNGYAEYVCPQCGNKKQVPFTCKSRFCTSCGKIYIDKWVVPTKQCRFGNTALLYFVNTCFFAMCCQKI